MKKAVLFDIDGTLLDSVWDIMDAMNAMLSLHGFELVTVDEMKSYLGVSARGIVELSLKKDVGEELLERCLEEYTDFYVKGKSPKTKPFEGIKEVISELKRRGYKIGAVSNKPQHEIEPLMESRLSPLGIDYALGLSDTVLPKPDPRGAIKALEDLGAVAEESYFVGDGETDVEVATRANMKCVAVLWGNRKREELAKFGAKIFAQKPSEILDIIR